MGARITNVDGRYQVERWQGFEPVASFDALYEAEAFCLGLDGKDLPTGWDSVGDFVRLNKTRAAWQKAAQHRVNDEIGTTVKRRRALTLRCEGCRRTFPLDQLKVCGVSFQEPSGRHYCAACIEARLKR